MSSWKNMLLLHSLIVAICSKKRDMLWFVLLRRFCSYKPIYSNNNSYFASLSEDPIWIGMSFQSGVLHESCYTLYRDKYKNNLKQKNKFSTSLEIIGFPFMYFPAPSSKKKFLLTFFYFFPATKSIKQRTIILLYE